MWDISKHKPFHKYVHFFLRDTFLLPTPKSEGWVKASSHYHSGDIASKERLTLKNVRWTAASESETDHPKSRKQLYSGHCKIIFFWANYMLAVKMTQLWLLSPFFFFNKEFSLRIKRHTISVLRAILRSIYIIIRYLCCADTAHKFKPEGTELFIFLPELLNHVAYSSSVAH